MRIAVLADSNRFDQFIKHYKLKKDSLKCLNRVTDIDGNKFDYFVAIHTHLDLSDLIYRLRRLGVEEINIEKLTELCA